MLTHGRIYQGDCVELLAKLGLGSVDLAFADPPFNIGYEYDVYEDRQSHSKYLDWSRQWISGIHHCLKSTGTFWLAIGDEYAAELKLIAQEVGFTCRSWVIWYYTFGINCTRKFNRSHAHLFHFVRRSHNLHIQLRRYRFTSAIRTPIGICRFTGQPSGAAAGRYVDSSAARRIKWVFFRSRHMVLSASCGNF